MSAVSGVARWPFLQPQRILQQIPPQRHLAAPTAAVRTAGSVLRRLQHRWAELLDGLLYGALCRQALGVLLTGGGAVDDRRSLPAAANATAAGLT